jgi:hypothetical protein
MNRQLRNRVKYAKDFLKVMMASFSRPQYGPKVFCIGYNKTGTTSLARSLKALGFKHATYNKVIWKDYYANKKIDKIIKYTSKFDSLDDLPWLKEDMIPLLDETFPGSKFIYLERDEESWKKSIYNWTYKKRGDHPDIEDSVKKFRAHRDFVLNYFENRGPEEFIVMSIKDPDGFKKLANFVGKETDLTGFPHFNRT